MSDVITPNGCTCPDTNWGWACIEMRVYGPCGHERCYGACSYAGHCACPKHEEIDHDSYTVEGKRR